MLSRLASALPPAQKERAKALYRQARAAYIKRFRSYESEALVATLRGLGVAPGDAVMVHAAYSGANGFLGSPLQFLAALRAAVGEQGTLLMPTSPYGGMTIDYLRSGEVFDVRRSPSRMGILSELLRRQRGALRSLNPAHPVAAAGPRAAWFVAGHESCLFSCGPGSPFEKLVEADAKALFVDCGLLYLMFFHYLEHKVHEALPFPLYSDEVHEMAAIDAEGRETSVRTRPFTKVARDARRFELLEEELRARRRIAEARIGNTALALVRIRDSVEATERMAEAGRYFYDLG